LNAVPAGVQLSSLKSSVITVAGKPAKIATGGVLALQLEGLLVVGLSLLLAFAVMAFGSAEYWAMCTLQVASAVLFVIWAASQWANGRVEISYSPLFVPLLLLAGLIAFQLVWPRTEYWYATWFKALQWMCYAILFFISTQVLRGADRLKAFGLFLTCFGSLVALIAIAQGGTQSDKVFWIFSTDPGSVFYGPYPNHAHYAGLMEMLFPIPLVLGLSSLFRSHGRTLLIFAALIMAGSIFLAASFGGIISFGGELAFLAILLLRQRRRGRVLLWGLVLLLGFSLLIVILQPAALQERLEHAQSKTEQMDATTRLAIARDSVPMILKKPLLGYGLGCFVEVFPSFRSFYTNDTVNAAHNDYVQALVELGLVGFALVAALVFLLLREGLRKARHWEHDCESSMAMAALVGCVGILIHSLCDFNLQIPANAAMFATLAAVAAAKPLGFGTRSPRRNGLKPRAAWSDE
jgi:O-antigen ligase